MKTVKEKYERNVSAITVGECELRAHVSETVRAGMGETLNGLPDASGQLIKLAAMSIMHDMPALEPGHYERNFQTTAATVRPQMLKLRRVPLETAIIERYCRRENSSDKIFGFFEPLGRTKAGTATVHEYGQEVPA